MRLKCICREERRLVQCDQCGGKDTVCTKYISGGDVVVDWYGVPEGAHSCHSWPSLGLTAQRGREVVWEEW